MADILIGKVGYDPMTRSEAIFSVTDIEINWVEFFSLDSAFNFLAKASAAVPSSCGGKVLLDLSSSMRTFQNNSKCYFSYTCTPNLPEKV